MWYEICTYDQERNDLLDGKYVGYDYELELMEKAGYLPVRNNDGTIASFTPKRDESNINDEFSNMHIGMYAEALTTGSNKTAMGFQALQGVYISSEQNIGIGWDVVEKRTETLKDTSMFK